MAKTDEGHKLTDKELSKLERRITKLYREAGKELQGTIDAYFEQFKKRDEEMKALIGTVQNGKEWTEADYKQWRLNQIGRGERYQAMRDKVAHRVTDANAVAVSYTNDATPGIYSLNRNYAAYTIESVAGDVGFDLWDEQTVKRLVVEQPGLMPYYPKNRALKRGIDLAYGKKQITASVTSSILQGKSIKHMADDLQKRITIMSRNSAIRTARTAVTGAQNAGRMDSYAAAEKIGIKLKKQWLATLDNRTRHSHAMLDGEKVDQDKKFSNGCRFPGDPQGPAWEIYNCRCTLVADVDGVDTSTGQRRAKNPVTGETEVISDMTYSEWAEQKQAEDAAAWNTYMKKGRNLSTDTKQWQEYKSVLGNKVPNTVEKFQNLKYNEPDKWAQLKTMKRQTVFVNNAECVTTPKKYTGYFLKDGAKHADQFFDVGYTADNPLQLRYDMARQFDMSKAVDVQELNGGAIMFNIYMTLGVTKQRTFLTGWIQDTPDSKPRIVTGFRKNKENSHD